MCSNVLRENGSQRDEWQYIKHLYRSFRYTWCLTVGSSQREFLVIDFDTVSRHPSEFIMEMGLCKEPLFAILLIPFITVTRDGTLTRR